LRSIEEIWAFNVFIAVGSIGVHAIGLDLDVNCILGWIALIECDCTAKVVEPAIHVADPEMAYLEDNCGVDWVDLEGIRLGYRCPSEDEATQ
jgi:hypothetical protein